MLFWGQHIFQGKPTTQVPAATPIEVETYEAHISFHRPSDILELLLRHYASTVFSPRFRPAL